MKIEIWKGDFFIAEVESVEEMLNHNLEGITSVVFLSDDEDYGKDVIWEKEEGWSEAV